MDRLGTHSPEQGRHWYALIPFLKHAKEQMKPGVKWDDYVTRQQQKEREGLAADFQALQQKVTNLFTEAHEADEAQEADQS